MKWLIVLTIFLFVQYVVRVFLLSNHASTVNREVNKNNPPGGGRGGSDCKCSNCGCNKRYK